MITDRLLTSEEKKSDLSNCKQQRATTVGSLERATPKVKCDVIDVRILCAREIFTRFFSAAKLLKGMVARDGIEPPTPAFSGPRSTN
jgi:hypothetical protein